MMREVYISFDLWNTLITPNPAYKEARTQYLASKFDLPKARVEQAHLHIKKTLDAVNEAGMSLSSRDCWEMMCVSLGGQQDESLYKDMQFLAWENAPLMSEEIVQWLNELSTIAQVSILSNTNMIQGQTLLAILRKHGVRTDLFRSTLFSDEHGIAKPNVRFFEQLEFPIDAQVRCHVGDTFVTDGIGANSAGIPFIHVSSPEDTICMVEDHLYRTF